MRTLEFDHGVVRGPGIGAWMDSTTDPGPTATIRSTKYEVRMKTRPSAGLVFLRTSYFEMSGPGGNRTPVSCTSDRCRSRWTTGPGQSSRWDLNPRPSPYQ